MPAILERSAPRLPSDPALPHLALAFDTAMMGLLLSESVAAGPRPVELRDCSIARVKYRPGRNCLVLYRARLRDLNRSTETDQFFHAGMYSPEEAERRYEEALRRSIPPAGGGAPVTFDREHSLVIWAFPNERKLRALPRLASVTTVRDEMLPQLARARFGNRIEVSDCVLTPVSYFPEHAYTVRATARLTGADAPGEAWTLYAKTDATGSGARTMANMRELWASAARRDGRLRMPRPLAYQDGSILWQEGSPGFTLETLADDAGLPSAILRRVGAMVAALHGTDIAGLPSAAETPLVQRLSDAASAIAAVMPHLAQRTTALVTELLRRAPGAAARPVTLHGDLHLNNLLADGDEIGIVDFDDLHSGAAEAELGSFIAGLIYRGVVHHAEQAQPGPAATEFLTSYVQHARWPVDRRIVDWHIAAALIGERAWRCLTSLKPGRLERIEALLDLAAMWTRSVTR